MSRRKIEWLLLDEYMLTSWWIYITLFTYNLTLYTHNIFRKIFWTPGFSSIHIQIPASRLMRKRCQVIHWKSDMTHSDVHGRIDKKKKHWEICIETSQCLISIIEMFFSNLPMFFRFSKRTKGQKDTYDCYLFILV